MANGSNGSTSEVSHHIFKPMIVVVRASRERKLRLGLGRTRKDALANYNAVHEQQQDRLSRFKQYLLNGTQLSYRIEQLQQNIHKSNLFPLRGLVLPGTLTGGGGPYSEVGVLESAARTASSTGVLIPPSSDTLDRFSGRPCATITAIAIATIRKMTGVQRILQILAPSSLKSRDG